MKSIACHTLGCKVNQYDTQAMLESFERAGYWPVDWNDDAGADIYLINTCTVTGTGDQKSLKLIRRTHRQHPQSQIIVAGCLAQRDYVRVRLPGVRLIIGVKQRARVVELFQRAMEADEVVCAVEEGGAWSFENLSVARHEGKTRATMKIQEGCDRYCAYCVIPYVRGPIRSMPLELIRDEAKRLCASGYREIVVTGIHLASYGRECGMELMDALHVIDDVEGLDRMRLGSLEPTVVTDAFVEALMALKTLCTQFHLSMQSGSAGVLSRMRRRYTPDEYLSAAHRLRKAFPDCAITTDVLTGFPGETDHEAIETEEFIKKVGFARIHVFPYSRRSGTAADLMSDQVREEVKQCRAGRLIEIGNQLENEFVQKTIGTTRSVLFETGVGGGLSEGYTPEYVRVRAKAKPGQLCDVEIQGMSDTAGIVRGTTRGGVGNPMENCLFCKIASGEIGSTKVYEDDLCMAFLDINPQAKAHMLVIPKAHYANVHVCAMNDVDLLGKLFARAAQIAEDNGMDKTGFRLVTNCGKDAQQSVDHFHIHILGGQPLSGQMG